MKDFSVLSIMGKISKTPLYILTFLKKKVYFFLFERITKGDEGGERETKNRKRERELSIFWFTPHIATMAGAEPI